MSIKRISITLIFLALIVSGWTALTRIDERFFGKEKVMQHSEIIGRELVFSVPMIAIDETTQAIKKASVNYRKVDKWLTEKSTLDEFPSMSEKWSYQNLPIGIHFFVKEAYTVSDSWGQSMTLILEDNNGELYYGGELLLKHSI